MHPTIKLIARSMGVAALVLVAINTAALSLAMTIQGMAENWSVKMKHGAFMLNGNAIGFQFGEPASIALLLLAFVAAFAYHFRKGRSNLDTTG